MSRAQRTITVARPVDAVFAFFTDPSNDRQWRRHVKEISGDKPLHVGSVIHQVIAGPGGRSIPADLEVMAYEPPTRYQFRVVAGPVRPVGEFRFTPTDAGSQVTFSLEATLSGIKKLLMSMPVQRSMDGEMAALDEAKARLEAS